MTTIAANRKMMACDSRVICGEAYSPGQKVYTEFPGGKLVGVAGEGRAMGLFLRWMKEGEPEAMPELGEDSGSFNALVLKPEGLFTYDSSFWPDPVYRDYHAIGTGTQSALTAMFLGLDPYHAVITACEFDPNSGLPARSFLLDDVLPKRKGKR